MNNTLKKLMILDGLYKIHCAQWTPSGKGQFFVWKKINVAHSQWVRGGRFSLLFNACGNAVSFVAITSRISPLYHFYSNWTAAATVDGSGFGSTYIHMNRLKRMRAREFKRMYNIVIYEYISIITLCSNIYIILFFLVLTTFDYVRSRKCT